MIRLAVLVALVLVLLSERGEAQNLSCQRLTVPVPGTGVAAVDEYTEGMGARLISTLTGQSVSSDYVIVLVGPETVWIVVVRGALGCPLPPIPRGAYDQARRPLMGVAG